MFRIIGCIIAIMLIAGCKEAGGGGAAVLSGLLGGGGSVSGSISGGGSSSGVSVIEHGPEPATVALLGTGLAGYAFLKLRKKKK